MYILLKQLTHNFAKLITNALCIMFNDCILILFLSCEIVQAVVKNLIIDTDIFSDVDDAAALLLGATLPGVNLLGVNVNYPSTYSVLATSAILAHYGHPYVPISAQRPLNNNTFLDTLNFEKGEYCSKVAYHWSGGSLPWGKAENAWLPVDLYRRLLANADDRSVTIVSIGFLDSLSALLNSTADSYSSLDGRTLIKLKVNELVIMGGDYPKGHSWNFWGSNSALSAHVVNTWDGRITFIGGEVGKHVLTGGSLMAKGPYSDPVRMSYIYYTYLNMHASWDPLAIMYAAYGLGDLFEFGNQHGYNHVEPNGTNNWIDDPSKVEQHYLHLKTSESKAAAKLDKLYLHAARKFSYKKPVRPPQLVKAPRIDHSEFSLWTVIGWTFMLAGVVAIAFLIHDTRVLRTWWNRVRVS
ncbi:uncharacterized protein PV09_02109 [Verruconis gallopava]|uniref:Uncharacterized protein n=1 Tax=Verruconis gallopava TaxID=253628 RepID=A0A0D2B7M9_9PEZI|nr:uncharacterized protein PV09_02109 [Verruconis gallopava]KIW07254.1 hypothetical protein PV09_02109 [Verruconis gallopava]